jgi:hypothetical protein
MDAALVLCVGLGRPAVGAVGATGTAGTAGTAGLRTAALGGAPFLALTVEFSRLKNVLSELQELRRHLSDSERRPRNVSKDPSLATKILENE